MVGNLIVTYHPTNYKEDLNENKVQLPHQLTWTELRKIKNWVVDNIRMSKWFILSMYALIVTADRGLKKRGGSSSSIIVPRQEGTVPIADCSILT
jgi:hypothetical protein